MPSLQIDQHEAILESLREKSRLASLRADISEAFNRHGELDLVLQKCTDALVKNLAAAFARIWVLDKSGEVLELRASSGLYTHIDGPHGRVKVGDFKIGRIAKNLKAHVSNSVVTDPEVSNPEWARREGMISFAGYPLTMQGKALGVVAFFAKKPLSEDILNELEPIADGIAQWIKRKQAELALVEQQEWLDVTLKSIGDAVVATDTDGRVTFLNPVAESLTGWNFQNAFGQPLEKVFCIVHETTRQPVENPVSKSLREKQIVGLANHTILLAKDGKEISIDDSASPIRNGKGEIIGVILVFHEITARRKAEREVEMALEQAREARKEAELLNQVGMSLSSELELQKVVQVAVDAGRELSGAQFGAFFYNATDEEGSRFSHCVFSGINPTDFAQLGLSRHSPLLVPTLEGGTAQRIGDLGAGRSGSGSPPALRSFLGMPVVSRGGSTLGALFFGDAEPQKFGEPAARLAKGIAAQSASALDNSQLYGALKKAKAELAAHAHTLEEHVRDRTLRLTETIESLEGVSYSIAHDLRGPLRSMEAFSTALLEDCGEELSPTAKEYAQRITSSAHRMDALIKELLTYGKLAQQDIPLTRVSVDDAVKRVLQLLEATIQKSQARIEIKPLGEVMANASVLEQAILNLITNALKFVSPGVPPHLEIQSEEREGHLRVSFRDFGIGIAAKYQERIFKIFERLDPRGYEGTGIGLALVRKSTERMGGKVGVDSFLGGGSTFWIELPSAP